MSETPVHDVHPNPDTLADHAEGLLPSAQSAEVARHLLTCAACRDVRDSLAEVSTLLTAYADPGPMPADVADRLDAALAQARADEAAADDEALETARAAEPAAAATVVPADTGRPAGGLPWHSKVLQVAAVVVLLAALGGVAVSGILHGSGSDGGSSAGSAAGAQDQRSSGSGSGAGSGAVTRTLLSASGTAYTISNLGTAAQRLANGEKAAADAQSSAAPTASALASPSRAFADELPADQRALTSSPVALDACVKRLTGGSVRPIAVDIGTWAGSPATIIVLPGQDDPSMLDVFAVRASCPPGSFLGFVRVSR
jgi:hypothetical protein